MPLAHNDIETASYKWAKKIRLYLSSRKVEPLLYIYVAGLGTGALDSTFSMASASWRFC
jgi:hypothetical protein